MSDQWETYACQMGELPAFITYDHGVAEELEALPFPNLVGSRIPLDQPDEPWLPCADEFDWLNAVEDALLAGFAPDQGLRVGRGDDRRRAVGVLLHVS
jgi:hypothetical protein